MVVSWWIVGFSPSATHTPLLIDKLSRIRVIVDYSLGVAHCFLRQGSMHILSGLIIQEVAYRSMSSRLIIL